MSSHDNKAFDRSSDDLVQDEKKQSTSRVRGPRLSFYFYFYFL